MAYHLLSLPKGIEVSGPLTYPYRVGTSRLATSIFLDKKQKNCVKDSFFSLITDLLVSLQIFYGARAPYYPSLKGGIYVRFPDIGDSYGFQVSLCGDQDYGLGLLSLKMKKDITQLCLLIIIFY